MANNKNRRIKGLPALIVLAGWLCGAPVELIWAEQPTPLASDQGATVSSQAAETQQSPSPTLDPAAPTPTLAQNTGSNELGDSMRNTGNSYWLDNYPLNDLYQYLATQANFQYFHSAALGSIRVTGQLFKTGDPLENMRELALQYNLVLYQRGRTIYAKTQEQITELPQQEFRYELKYLHPTQDNVQAMLGHFLTPDRGSISRDQGANNSLADDTRLDKISARPRSSVRVLR